MRLHLPITILALSTLLLAPPRLFAQEHREDSLKLLESLDLNSARIMSVPAGEIVESERMHLELPVIEGMKAELELAPKSVRAAGYKLFVSDEKGGLRERKPSRSHTFRGRYKIHGGEQGAAAVSLRGGRVQARLLPDEDLPDIYIEPLNDGEHVAYTPEDVSAPAKSCGAEAPPDAEQGEAGADATSGDAVVAAAAGLFECEIAVDVDYEMYQAWSSNVETVEANVDDLLNKMNVQYERDVGITMVLSALVIRSSSAGNPYTTNDYSDLLDQFQNQVSNGALKSVTRDIAHLFTGRDLTGSVIGIAYMSVVCSSSYGIGLSQVGFSSATSSQTDLLAHEIGHNFGASHCNCLGWTMNPYITSSNRFNSGSISEIVAQRDTRSCLNEVDGGGGGGDSSGGGDTTPPTLQITQPAAGASLTGVVSVQATATDDSGIAHVEFFLRGASLGSDTSSPFAMSFDTAGYSEGAAAIKVVAVDASAASNSAEVTINVTIAAPPSADDPGQPFVDANDDQRYVSANGDKLLPLSVFSDGRFDVRTQETGYDSPVTNGGLVIPPSVRELSVSGSLVLTAYGDLLIDAQLSGGASMDLSSLNGDVRIGTRLDTAVAIECATDLQVRAPMGGVDAAGSFMSANKVTISASARADLSGAVLDGVASVKATVNAGELDVSNVSASASSATGEAVLRCRDNLYADGALLVAKTAQLISSQKGVSAINARLETCASANGDALIQGKNASDLRGAVLLAGHTARAAVSSSSDLDLRGATVANTGGTGGEVAVRGKTIRVDGATILDAGTNDPTVRGTLSGTPDEFGSGTLACE